MNRIGSSSSAGTHRHAKITPVIWLLLFVTFGVVLWMLPPASAGLKPIQQRIIACKTPKALRDYIAAESTGSKWQALAAGVGHCTVLSPGEQARVIEYGGIVWWRVKVEYDGRIYWTPRDAV